MRIAPIPILAAVLMMAGNLLPAADPPSEVANLSIYEADACAAPGYSAMPLNLELYRQCPPNCCDDVWAGYCEKKRQGLCLPSVRLLRHPCGHPPAATCSESLDAGHEPAPALAPAPTPVPQATVPKAEIKPVPAATLPPPPDSPKLPANALDSPSPSDTTNAPFPMFNPAAWNIGGVVK